MDKTLVNHQIVSMRKLVKNARQNQIRKMFKQINQFKKKIEKWQQLNDVEKDIKTKHLRKLNNRLQAKQKESKILKSLKPDTVSKYALVHKENELNKILNLSNSTIEERAISLLAKNKLVQANVKKFRNDNPGCEEWLPQQIELWEHGTKRKNKSNVNSLISNPKKDQGSNQKKKEQQPNIITDSEKTLLTPIKEKPAKKSPLLKDNNKKEKDRNLNSSQTIYYTPNSSFKISKINEDDEEDSDEDDDNDEQVENNKPKLGQTQKFESKLIKNGKKALIKRIRMADIILLRQFLEKHTDTFLKIDSVNKIFMPMFLHALLMYVPMNAFMIRTMVYHEQTFIYKLFFSLFMFIQVNTIFIIHLFFTMYNKKIHQTGIPLLLSLNSRIHYSYYNRKLGNHIKWSRVRFTSLNHWKVIHYIEKFHTNKQYGLTYGSLTLVNLASLFKCTIIYSRVLLQFFKLLLYI